MKRYKILTLVDITETRQNRKEVDKELAYQQQQNFNTLIQSIGMRVNPLYEVGPTQISVDLKVHQFGTAHKGLHRVWTWDFAIEFDGGFTDATGNEIGHLFNDLNFIPIITGLDETAKLTVPVFDTKSDSDRNTIIQIS